LRARVRGIPASQKIEFAFLAPLIIRRIAARGLRVPRPDFLAMPFYRGRERDVTRHRREPAQRKQL
jgi:hypothetical protein